MTPDAESTAIQGGLSSPPETVEMSAAGYLHHLLNGVMPFWVDHSPDRESGGFFHCLDRAGGVTDTRKNTWCQARQTWMFSHLHRRYPQGERWIELARLGRDYLVEHCYAGDGRWHYMTDRSGRVVEGARSWFADLFAMTALCEYDLAAGSRSDRTIIDATLKTVLAGLRSPETTGFHHLGIDARYVWHGPYMAFVGAAPSLWPVIESRELDAALEEALHRVLWFFSRDDEQALYECLGPDGSLVEEADGQRLNPGHALESMWFCLDEAVRRDDQDAVRRAIQVAGWMFDKGWDAEYGGLLAFVDDQGRQPPGPEVINSWGERWDDKVWWVHAEALIIAAWSARITNDPAWRDRWRRLHDYTFAHFPDPQHGGWFEYLDRRTAQPHYDDKGKWIKCAFHVPRALVKLTSVLDA